MSQLQSLAFAIASCALLLACGGESDNSSSTGGAPGTGATGAGGMMGSGGSVAISTQCQVHADCAVNSASCCGSCGAPTQNDVIAIATSDVAAYRAAACGTKPVACPACATGSNLRFLATCESGSCKVIDLGNSPVTACTSDADCTLRATACCECGAPMELGSLVAISSNAGTGFSALVCDANQVCAMCMPQYPTNIKLSCTAGHCVIPGI